jgi:pimeloyl-ACP methyl ester carboxylesterase
MVTPSGRRLLQYGCRDRTALTLVHGGPGLPGYMRTLGSFLKSDFSIAEYYQRDFAPIRAKGPFTIDAYESDLGSVVAGQRRPATVIGHSFGAAVAIEYAKRRSPGLERVVLLNPVLDRVTWARFVERLMKKLRSMDPRIDDKLARADAELRESAGRERFRAMHRLNDLYWPAYFPSGRKPAGLLFEKVNVDAVEKIEADFQKALRADRFLKGLEKVRAPVVQIHGALDPVPWRQGSGALRRRLKDFRFHLIAKAGHFPWLDAAARGAFLSTLRASLA